MPWKKLITQKVRQASKQQESRKTDRHTVTPVPHIHFSNNFCSKCFKKTHLLEKQRLNTFIFAHGESNFSYRLEELSWCWLDICLRRGSLLCVCKAVGSKKGVCWTGGDLPFPHKRKSSYDEAIIFCKGELNCSLLIMEFLKVLK